MNSILLISNDINFNKSFGRLAINSTLKVYIIDNLEKCHDFLESISCDAIVVHYPLPISYPPEVIIARIKSIVSTIPIFFISDNMHIDLAITLTRLGVQNCFSKPLCIEQTINNIQKQLHEKSNFTPHTLPDDANFKNEPVTVKKDQFIISNSAKAKILYKQIDLVADTNYKVLIYGETGTGKEAVARRLTNGIYKNKAFISINCGCLNRELALSELFGHVKGSFNGAYNDKIGAFEAANNGTLFLDEIDNLECSVQALLLRALEENKIKKVGSNKEIPINIRLITASNDNLLELVEKGKFRGDLYYRLNEFEIHVSPLRERKEDIKDFIHYFIQEANEMLNKNIIGIENRTLESLINYNWPGNIRELKNEIKRASLVADKYITTACLSDIFIQKLTNYKEEISFNHNYTIDNLNKEDPLKYQSLKAEYEKIIATLKKVNYNKTQAAQLLNINRKTLYNKLRLFEKKFNNNKNKE